jgi:hypothetical protein
MGTGEEAEVHIYVHFLIRSNLNIKQGYFLEYKTLFSLKMSPKSVCVIVQKICYLVGGPEIS